MVGRNPAIDEDEAGGVETTTVGVFRTAATVKGGRRFSFGALVVAGDRRGSVGIGYAKGKEVPPAIEKAEKDARRNLKRFPLIKGTIPHTVLGRFGASEVRMVPASPGTGVVAGATVRAVLELAGIRDCLTKSYGSTNKKNLVKATMAGLNDLRSKSQVEELRGVDIEQTHVEVFTEGAPEFVAMPKKRLSQTEQGGGRRGGRGGAGGGGRSRRRSGRGEADGASADTHASAGASESGESGSSESVESNQPNTESSE